MALYDDGLFGLRDESRRRVALACEPSCNGDLSAHRRQTIRMAADARDDLPTVDAEHRMVTESQHFYAVGVQPHKDAGFTQNALCRCGVECGLFARRHAV
ncbi:hypothetical protein ACFXPN_25880 [Streptomyces griseorubiginosus]|uniref:hypothetical protein n=1 Tax=Streptomyces griseorubiginosus TaxID=67304 RepID=UPI0036C25FED